MEVDDLFYGNDLSWDTHTTWDWVEFPKEPEWDRFETPYHLSKEDLFFYNRYEQSNAAAFFLARTFYGAFGQWRENPIEPFEVPTALWAESVGRGCEPIVTVTSQWTDPDDAKGFRRHISEQLGVLFQMSYAMVDNRTDHRNFIFVVRSELWIPPDN